MWCVVNDAEQALKKDQHFVLNYKLPVGTFHSGISQPTYEQKFFENKIPNEKGKTFFGLGVKMSRLFFASPFRGIENETVIPLGCE